MNTKKIYVDLIEFLETNKNKKVDTILEEVYKMTSTKQNSRNFLKNESGKVTHVYCYYHKLWEPVDKVEYGSKKNSTTGLNSMCKEGVNQWTKQQREFKQKDSELLQLVMAGEVSPDDIQEYKSKYEQEKDRIEPRSDGIGYKTIEELE